LDDHRGMSPLVPARLAVAMHTQSTRHNVALAQNQCRPSGLLFVRGRTLQDEERWRLEDSLRQLGSGGAGSILLLNGDFEWQDLGIRPRDMDFIQLMQETLRNIADCLGVPETCLNSGDRSQYPGYFDAARALFWEETLLPLLEMIRTSLERWIRPVWPGVELSYNKDAIDALIARREKFSEKVANCRDVLTLNEQRALLGYGPIAGGDGLASCAEPEV
jgi:HK97 family phage portal protein